MGSLNDGLKFWFYCQYCSVFWRVLGYFVWCRHFLQLTPNNSNLPFNQEATLSLFSSLSAANKVLSFLLLNFVHSACVTTPNLCNYTFLCCASLLAASVQSFGHWCHVGLCAAPYGGCALSALAHAWLVRSVEASERLECLLGPALSQIPASSIMAAFVWKVIFEQFAFHSIWWMAWTCLCVCFYFVRTCFRPLFLEIVGFLLSMLSRL